MVYMLSPLTVFLVTLSGHYMLWQSTVPLSDFAYQAWLGRKEGREASRRGLRTSGNKLYRSNLWAAFTVKSYKLSQNSIKGPFNRIDSTYSYLLRALHFIFPKAWPSYYTWERAWSENLKHHQFTNSLFCKMFLFQYWVHNRQFKIIPFGVGREEACVSEDLSSNPQNLYIARHGNVLM